MSIKVGDRLPEANFVTMGENGPERRSISDIFRGKRVVLFAVPGAFTPTCHLKHMPGFIQQAEAFRARGIDSIACVAVNDIHVLTAWGKASGADGTILFLADGNGDFTRAIGMELDGTAFGMGRRSQRYAMLVEDRVVNAIHLEAQPGIADESSAEKLLAVVQ
jgi:peroxiredoxin